MTLRRFLTSLFAVVLVLLGACLSTQPGTVDRGEYQERGEGDPRPGDMLLAVGNLPNLVFQGVTRANAKTTMVTGVPVTYTSIATVTSLTPPVVTSTSPRTGVENDLAQFTAYLYAYNLPADNDFHLIIGDTPVFTPGTTNLINVEVSGLPAPGNVQFTTVRQDFLNIIGNPATMAQSMYYCLAVPIQITVRGGPFWDTSHKSGGSGTSMCYGGVTMKTGNGWELHPVSAIQ